MKKHCVDNQFVDAISKLIPYRNNLGMIKKEWIQKIVSFLSEYEYEAIGIVDIAGESLVFKVKDARKNVALKVALPHMQITKKNIFIYSAFNYFKSDSTGLMKKRFHRGSEIQEKVFNLIKEKNEKSFIVPEVYKKEEEPLWLAMEFIDSIDVLRYVQQKRDINIALDIFLNLLDAILFCHKNNIVHRDLKSENIMIWKKKTVCLLDFSMAKEINDKRLTLFGTIKGTHMSPKVMAGDFADFSFVDDILALGFIFHEFWTKKKIKGYITDEELTSSSEEDVYNKYKKHRKELAEDLPREVKNIFLKATDPDETKRYQVIHSFREDVIKLKNILLNQQQKREVSFKFNTKKINRKALVEEYFKEQCHFCNKESSSCDLQNFCKATLFRQLDFYIYLKKKNI